MCRKFRIKTGRPRAPCPWSTLLIVICGAASLSSLPASFCLPPFSYTYTHTQRECLRVHACIHIQYCVAYKAEHIYNTIRCHISSWASTGSRSLKPTFWQQLVLSAQYFENQPLRVSAPTPVHKGSTRRTSLQCPKHSLWVGSCTQETRPCAGHR